jgi:cyanophycinase
MKAYGDGEMSSPLPVSPEPAVPDAPSATDPAVGVVEGVAGGAQPVPALWHPGPLALVGGAEWTAGCDFDEELWEASGRAEVLILPTAAAYEHPYRAVDRAVAHFARFGARARALDVLARGDAEDEMLAAEVRRARFIYLSGGSALHLRSVLKDSRVWSALCAAWEDGAVIAGSAAGAMVLGDPMVDPRGGALTLGLGLFHRLALVPRAKAWSPETSHRTIGLARGELRIAAVDEATALIADPHGAWRVAGAGHVTVFADGHPTGLDALPAPTASP